MNKAILISSYRNRQQNLRKKKELLVVLTSQRTSRQEAEAYYDRLINFLDRAIGYVQRKGIEANANAKTEFIPSYFKRI